MVSTPESKSVLNELKPQCFRLFSLEQIAPNALLAASAKQVAFFFQNSNVHRIAPLDTCIRVQSSDTFRQK